MTRLLIELGAIAIISGLMCKLFQIKLWVQL